MSTISLLTKIRAEVELQVEERFIPVLVDKAVKFHCRKGLRTWCDCEFCSTKKRGTWDIATGFHPPHPHFGTAYWPPSDNIASMWRSMSERIRETKREVLRRDLARAKQRVI